jgi:hypothetical protein
MFAAISTYGVTDFDDMSELAKNQFLPIVQTVPGFRAEQGPRRGGPCRPSDLTDEPGWLEPWRRQP